MLKNTLPPQPQYYILTGFCFCFSIKNTFFIIKLLNHKIKFLVNVTYVKDSKESLTDNSLLFLILLVLPEINKF